MKDHFSNLFHLICLGVVPLRLQVQYLAHAILGEDMVVAVNALNKTEALQKIAQRIEFDVLVRCSAKNPIEKLGVRRHADNVQQDSLQCTRPPNGLAMSRKRRGPSRLRYDGTMARRLSAPLPC